MQEHPWQNVSTDIFTPDGKDYLLTVDTYSNYFVLDFLPDLKSSTVIRKLKVHFATFRVPEMLKSENASQFVSEQMTAFAKEW